MKHPRTGAMLRSERPLDFLVVADHAEMLGIFPRLAEADPDHPYIATVRGYGYKLQGP